MNFSALKYLETLIEHDYPGHPFIASEHSIKSLAHQIELGANEYLKNLKALNNNVLRYPPTELEEENGWLQEEALDMGSLLKKVI